MNFGSAPQPKLQPKLGGSPSGETDLSVLLASMSAVLDQDLYVFVTLKRPNALLDSASLTIKMRLEEAEGTTLILPHTQAVALKLDYQFPSRMITLNVHSSLDAVGFLATITTALAGLGMGVNPVSGFFHDHLFVPDGREREAMNALARLAQDASGTIL